MTDHEQGEPAAVGILQKVTSRWQVQAQDILQAPPLDFSPPEGEYQPGPVSFKKRLTKTRRQLRPLQQVLYAGKQFSILLIFQALDAAGKDGAIREVLRGLDPAGVKVASFKRPTTQELAHDFLWRTSRELPERGNITAFNRSYYEEVLAVRVHPHFLQAQYAGANPVADSLWVERYRAIREHERHLATANTIVLKFWLNVSPQEQAKRFMQRLENPSKNWKFSAGDVAEAELRTAYDDALVHMFRETSRPWAPWFCIPADKRWYLREQIASILLQTLTALPLHFPTAALPVGGEHERVVQLIRKKLSTEN